MILCSSTYDPMFIQGMPVNLLGVSSSDSESADDDDDVNDARDSTEQEVNQLFETSDEDGEKDKEKKKPTKTKKQLHDVFALPLELSYGKRILNYL